MRCGKRDPVRVAIVSPTFGAYGGMEAYALAIARGLAADDGVEVRVFFKRARGFALAEPLAAAARATGGRVEFIAPGGAGVLRAVAWADVVHGQNASPDAALAARVLGRRLLMTMHAHRWPGASLRQRAWRWALGAADRRFFVSDFVRRTWEDAAARPGSEVVFPICELAEGVKPPAARRGFVFVARWIPNKGVDTLVAAYAQAGLDPERWPLRLLGDGPLRAEVLGEIARRKLRGVEAPGFLSQAEKAEAIRSARWLVVPPNTREDFGLTAIEARALGVPCIASRDGGVPEAAGEASLLCEPGDVAGLAACLRAAAEMDEAQYAARAARTKATLAAQLRGPEFYGRVYREMAGR